MPTGYHATINRNPSPNKRWQTTQRTALEDTLAQVQGATDRANTVKELKERKLANTKTSINFGNDKVNYLSDTMENMLRTTGQSTAEDRSQTVERIKAMKAELTTTNFRLGDETPEYRSVNQESMAISNQFKNSQRVQMNSALKEAVKKSSIHFGNDSVQYETVSHNAMQYRGNENNFSKLKEEVTNMTATLRRHNFTFGDEKVSYESDYQRGYGSIPLTAYQGSQAKRAGIRAIIEDSRSCHFSLGNDRPQYQSNTHTAMKVIEGNTSTDVFDQMQRAKDMKQALQKTSIVIGDDQEYF